MNNVIADCQAIQEERGRPARAGRANADAATLAASLPCSSLLLGSETSPHPSGVRVMMSSIQSSSLLLCQVFQQGQSRVQLQLLQ